MGGLLLFFPTLYNIWLVVLEHEFYDFPYTGNVIIPTDKLIFFRGVGIPPTSHTYIYMGQVWDSMLYGI